MLQKASREPRDIVVNRLYQEEICPGTSVRNDAAEFGLKPHVWSDEMIEFYKETKAFLYACSVWNRAPLKCKMRNWIGQFLTQKNLREAKVLLYGDGLGIDSAYLSMLGCHVTYYEPSEECVRFANEVFEKNDVQVNHIVDIQDVPMGSFDVVVCLDVLEHLPNPPETVKLLADFLRPDGLLITHSPFFFIEPYQPTHLISNLRYSGDFSLFTQNGLQPYAGSFFWDPIVVKKCETPPPDRSLWSVKLGKLLLQLGRYRPVVHSAVARLLARGDKKWLNELKKIQSEMAAQS